MFNIKRGQNAKKWWSVYNYHPKTKWQFYLSREVAFISEEFQGVRHRKSAEEDEAREEEYVGNLGASESV